MRVNLVSGVKVINASRFTDRRGTLIKPYQWNPSTREDFYTESKAGVIRGMHFQSPPWEHTKLVFCIKGRVLDVLLDLRASGFGHYSATELSDRNNLCLLIPPGIAHGFYAEEDSILYYATSSKHHPPADNGVRWNSFGMEWPTDNPTLSDRDLALPHLSQIRTPFK